MIESWREQLYFLGFLSSLAFGGRFLLQWMSSEIKQQSVVPTAFWYLSLIGNLLLLTHSFLQIQFHVVIVQTCNAVISWRNLNLLKPPSQSLSFRSTCLLLIGALGIVTTLFSIQAFYLPEGSDLFSASPSRPGIKTVIFPCLFSGMPSASWDCCCSAAASGCNGGVPSEEVQVI